MSDREASTTAEDDPQVPTLPGCGLAAYAGLLMALGLVGIVGMGGATYALLFGGGAGPSELVAGSQVATWRLEPMWDAGVLRPGDVPGAWHDESAARDGTTSCALLTDAVVRVEAGVGSRVAYADLLEVSIASGDGADVVVVARGAAGELRCRFGPGEGGERFTRQLQSEQPAASGADE